MLSTSSPPRSVLGWTGIAFSGHRCVKTQIASSSLFVVPELCNDTGRVVPCVPNVFYIILLRQNILHNIWIGTLYGLAGLESWKIFTHLESNNLKTARAIIKYKHQNIII